MTRSVKIPRFRDRFMCWEPNWAGKPYPHIWFGGDEYGNPSIVFTWFVSLIFFYNRNFQRDIEMPEPGDSDWVDVMYYYTDEKNGYRMVDHDA